MSAHEIVWEFDRDTVTGKLVCNDDNCQYRYECAQECEVTYGVEPHEGGYRHAAVEHEIGHVTLWHEMRKVDYCNFVEWLTIGDSVEELCADSDRFEIGRTPVDPVWLGEDGAEWKRT